MKILLATAQSSVAKRWQDLLSGERFIEQASSLDELTAKTSMGKFDLVLLHRALVELSHCAELRRAFPSIRIFLLSDQPDEKEGLLFLKTGIVGYGNTYISKKRLAEALHVVATGGVWLGQKVIQQLIMEAPFVNRRSLATNNLEKQLGLLTPMERKVAELVARGMTNLQIAAELDSAERTVKAHLTAIYEKTHVGNRLSLALLINRRANR